MDGHNGFDWFWMSFMSVFWIAVLGVAVSIAVKLGQRHGHTRR